MRNRQSAKKAGTAFESLLAEHLRSALNDDRIERRARSGRLDRGDIAGVRHMGQRVVIECKNTTRVDLAGWTREARVQAGNDDALVGVVIHKRHGVANPGDQWVTMTVADLCALLTGERVTQ